MAQRIDDLEAVRLLVATLQPFSAAERERIMRWSREKLGLSETDSAARTVTSVKELPSSVATASGKKSGKRPVGRPPKKAAVKPVKKLAGPVAEPQAKPVAAKGTTVALPIDFKSYVPARAAKSDTQFAAVVAHYLRTVAPKGARRASISSADYCDACTAVGRSKPSQPNVTLHNAQHGGVLKKGSKRGRFVLSPEGEKVAVSLEGATAAVKPAKVRMPAKRRVKAASKKAAKKVARK